MAAIEVPDLQRAVREAVAEAMREQADLIQRSVSEAVTQALEDVALVRAMREADDGELATPEEVEAVFAAAREGHDE